jgi:hypothetical protein
MAMSMTNPSTLRVMRNVLLTIYPKPKEGWMLESTCFVFHLDAETLGSLIA